MSQQRLFIYADTSKVGTLAFDTAGDDWSLTYEASWQRNAAAFPLANTLPLEREQHSSKTIRRFLEHLLPEGQALEDISIIFQLSKTNVGGLMGQLGAEPVGALSFRLEDSPPPQDENPGIELSPAALESKLHERPHIPIYVWNGKVRLSIAGVQDKLGVFEDPRTGRLYLPQGSLASTHILKFEREPAGAAPHLVANEHFCMSLAARLPRLPVAQVELLRTPTPVLKVRRFDRALAPGIGPHRVNRLHVIDACQALDLAVSQKYEHNFGNAPDVAHIRDGASFSKLASLLPLQRIPALAKQQLIAWAVLNVLIGNADAHGKNLSFHVGHSQLEIAPFYDLVSTAVYGRFDTELAMAIGDAFRFEATSAALEWAEFGAHFGLMPRQLGAIMKPLLRDALAAGQGLIEHAQHTYLPEELELVGRIWALIQMHAATLQTAIAALPGVRIENLSHEAEAALRPGSGSRNQAR